MANYRLAFRDKLNALQITVGVIKQVSSGAAMYHCFESATKGGESERAVCVKGRASDEDIIEFRVQSCPTQSYKTCSFKFKHKSIPRSVQWPLLTTLAINQKNEWVAPLLLRSLSLSKLFDQNMESYAWKRWALNIFLRFRPFLSLSLSLSFGDQLLATRLRLCSSLRSKISSLAHLTVHLWCLNQNLIS